jgi:hypothetical protein
MATNSKKKFAGSNVTEGQQRLDDAPSKSYQPILRPEQRHILAQVYYLILGWWECLVKSVPVIPVADTHMVPAISTQTIAVAVEA